MLTDPKVFLKAPWAPVCTYLHIREERAPKKTQFFGKTFKKCLKTPFLACFFLKILMRRRNFSPNRDYLVLWERSENQFDRLKKSLQKLENFLKIRPPFQKILVSPLPQILFAEELLIKHNFYTVNFNTQVLTFVTYSDLL